MKKAITLASCLLALSACQEKKESKAAVEVPKPVVAKVAPATIDSECQYIFVAPQSKLTWTAYKLTEKIGVSGSFDSINVSNQTPGNGFEQVLAQANFTIPVSSINSGLPARDAKLVNIFFGNMKETSSIQGQVLSMKDGQAVIKITLNGASKDVSFSYKRSGDKGEKLSMEGVLDLAMFSATDAMTSLNQACKGAHTGSDGITKMWPDVKLVIESTFGIVCPSASPVPAADHDHGHSHDH